MQLRSWLVMATVVATAGNAFAAPAPSAAPKPAVANAASPAPAPAVLAKYESLFGAEEKQVAATATTRDDTKFAAELLEKSKSLTDEPDLVALMCTKAYEFGRRDPAGYPAAAGAAKWLQTRDSKGVEWRERLIELYRAQFKRAADGERSEIGTALIDELASRAGQCEAGRGYADAAKFWKEAASVAASIQSAKVVELNLAVREAQVCQQVVEKLAKLESQLEQRPRDSALRSRILNLYLTVLDDPGSAEGFAAGQVDGDSRLVRLAARDLSELTDQECLSLADWYRKLADLSPPSDRSVPVGRAIALYGHYLEAHSRQDAERMLAMRGLEEALKLFDKSSASRRWSSRIVIWNQHNGNVGGRGSSSANLALFRGERTLWKRENIALGWSPASDAYNVVVVPALPFDRVRVEVTGYHGAGGGLAEIEIFHNGINMANGAAARSGSPAPALAFSADHVIDGVTSSAEYGRGYWLLPDKALGWIDVAMKSPLDP